MNKKTESTECFNIKNCNTRNYFNPVYRKGFEKQDAASYKKMRLNVINGW